MSDTDKQNEKLNALERASGLSGCWSTIKEIPKLVAERFKTIEARVTGLEEQPSVRYCGTFSEDNEYVPGDLCRHAGGLWLAVASTSQRPGTGPGWRLIVKRGDAVDRDAGRGQAGT
jgi:hypothetical protein